MSVSVEEAYTKCHRYCPLEQYGKHRNIHIPIFLEKPRVYWSQSVGQLDVAIGEAFTSTLNLSPLLSGRIDLDTVAERYENTLKYPEMPVYTFYNRDGPKDVLDSTDYSPALVDLGAPIDVIFPDGHGGQPVLSLNVGYYDNGILLFFRFFGTSMGENSIRAVFEAFFFHLSQVIGWLTNDELGDIRNRQERTFQSDDYFSRVPKSLLEKEPWPGIRNADFFNKSGLYRGIAPRVTRPPEYDPSSSSQWNFASVALFHYLHELPSDRISYIAHNLNIYMPEENRPDVSVSQVCTLKAILWLFITQVRYELGELNQESTSRMFGSTTLDIPIDTVPLCEISDTELNDPYFNAQRILSNT